MREVAVDISKLVQAGLPAAQRVWCETGRLILDVALLIPSLKPQLQLVQADADKRCAQPKTHHQ
jgi:hypothetical protein